MGAVDVMTEPQVWTLIGVFAAIMLGGMTLSTTLLSRVITARSEAIEARFETVTVKLDTLDDKVERLDREIGGISRHLFGLPDTRGD